MGAYERIIVWLFQQVWIEAKKFTFITSTLYENTKRFITNTSMYV